MNALALIGNDLLLDGGSLDTSLEVLSFGLGALLLLVALFGGGISIKVATIPRAGGRARLAAGIVSPLFFLLAVAMHFELIRVPGRDGADPNAQRAGVVDPNARPPEVVDPNPGPAKIVVGARLGHVDEAREIATELRVYLAGHPVPELSLDLETPSMSHQVSLPQPGDHPYSIEGYSVWSTDPNSKVSVRGNGTIIIRDGVAYTVSWDLMDKAPTTAGQPWRVRLRED